MLVNATEMLIKARDGHYGVPQFNINNLEWTKSVLTACEEMKSPVILGVSEGAGKYMTGFKTVAAMVSAMVDSMGITVPVALHLDHGTYEGCKACIEAGFSSIMFDGSHYSIDEIALPVVARTPLIAGNWKMNLDHVAATSLVQDLGEALKAAGYDSSKSEAVVIPPFTDIRPVAIIIDGDKLPIAYGAQDISAHDDGAYTGEVSAAQSTSAWLALLASRVSPALTLVLSTQPMPQACTVTGKNTFQGRAPGSMQRRPMRVRPHSLEPAGR